MDVAKTYQKHYEATKKDAVAASLTLAEALSEINDTLRASGLFPPEIQFESRLPAEEMLGRPAGPPPPALDPELPPARGSGSLE